jgi:hypothetical protein
MAEPVIHLTQQAHDIVKGFCKSRGLRMKTWVSETLVEVVRSSARPVKVRSLVDYQAEQEAGAEHEAAILSRPPFWRDRSDSC